MNTSSKWCAASVGLYLVVLLVGFTSVLDYGLSWDERFRFQGGDSKLEYYSALLAGEKPESHSSSYPGLFDVPLAIAHKYLPDLGTRSEKGHVWSLCFGLLGLLSVWRLSARIGGERAGFWALLLLTTLPRYYGHMFFNPKDIPLAGTYAFGVWALVELFSRLPKVSWKWVVWIGVSAGLAMSCRIAGFLVLVYFGAFIGLYLLYQIGRERQSMGSTVSDLTYWLKRGAVAGLIAYAILFLLWPTLHNSPFDAVESTVSTVQNFGWGGMVLMDGHFWA